MTIRFAVLSLVGLVACGPKDEEPTDHSGTTPTTVPGAEPIRINEIMAQNQSAFPDESLSYPDWIELWNPNADPVDLSGWWLSDDVNAPKLWTFPEATSLPGLGYLIVYCDEDIGALHASFHLDSAGAEDVVLTTSDVLGNITEDVVYDMAETFPDVSLARLPDGADTWIQDPTSTPGAANAQ